MKNNPFIPIIAIDGTASSGKGTVAYKLAQKLEFNYLNSGALYRLVAYQALKDGLDLTDEEKVINVAKNISPIFEGKKVIVDDVDIWPIISTQEYGQHASVISPIKELREVVFDLQRKMIKTPGLVAEGRDMCTHVFTDAHVKFYLDADVKERAKRRHKDETEKQSGKYFSRNEIKKLPKPVFIDKILDLIQTKTEEEYDAELKILLKYNCTCRIVNMCTININLYLYPCYLKKCKK